MKKLFLTLSLALTCTVMLAVPAKRGQWKTVKLADGTEVRVELRGDEFCHYWQAADGRQFVADEATGLYKVADMKSMMARAEVKRAQAIPNRSRRGPATRATIGGDHMPYEGEQKGLIILVNFSDKTFKTENNLELYRRIVNEEGFSEGNFVGSVRDYFSDQSKGKFTIDFDVVGPVTMDMPYAYYGGNVNGGDDASKVGQMIARACALVDDQVNFADYDWDGDGEVDQVFILYAGHGEASYSDPNTIWPHEYQLRYAIGQMPEMDGVRINTYACSCELGQTEAIDGIGTICHEFSHCLGLADMYDTSDNGYFGMGDWDLMGSGSYNNDSFTPAGYTSYERWYAGWIEPTELTEDTQVSAMQPLNESGEAYVIYNEGNRNEYYLLENRQRTGWDAAIPSSGLLILHVDFDSRVWASNQVNSTSRQRCTIFHADNSDGSNDRDQQGDAYPYNYVNSLTNTSTPAAEVNNLNSDGSYLMNKSVTNITRNSDGTMSFEFSDLTSSADDYNLPSSYIFYESFDQNTGTGGNDGVFSGSGVASESLVYDNEGWSSTSRHGADQCAMFGSSTMDGQATTPEINIDGEYEIWFKAAPYTGDGTSLTLDVREGDAMLETTDFIMMQGRWTVFHTKVTGSGPSTIRFRTNDGRFFLDKVCVTNEPINTGISGVTVDRTQVKDNRIFSLDGRYLGTDMNALQKGIYIVNGKKIIK